METDTLGQEYRVEMESEAASALAEADNLWEAARLEDLHLWNMEKEFYSRKGRKKCEYWMASWRRGSKVHNEYLGTFKKLNRQTALEMAKRIKAKDLGINKRSDSQFSSISPAAGLAHHHACCLAFL